MSAQYSEVDAATDASPEAQRAVKFRNEFVPEEGVDYGWVEEYAREQYESLLKTFANLDAKATAIIGYLSSGAGLFTLGSLAGVAAAKVPALHTTRQLR